MAHHTKILELLVGLVLVQQALGQEEGGEGEHEDPEHVKLIHIDWDRVEVPYMVGFWIIITTIVKLCYQKTPGISSYLPETSILVVTGLVVGIISFFVSESKLVTLTPDIFFLFLLPPIIGEAGYFMPNRLFFDQLGTILLMAVVGTIWNMLTISSALYLVGQTDLFGTHPGLLETFLFGSLIAAVDPVAVLAVFDEIKVDEVLNIVVFGESLLNDGVAVVLYHMFEAFAELGQENVTNKDIGLGLVSFFVVAGGGTLIGVIIGYIAAFTTRFMENARMLEPLVVLMFSYLSYLTAEVFHMSGILAITFCGITMKNYVEQNICEESSTAIKSAGHFLANCAEMMVFLFLGVFTVTYHDHEWNTWFIVCTILFCLIFRVLGVLILSYLANRFRIKKLDWLEQTIMMYGGLRGGVAFALVLLVETEHREMFVTATLAMVYFTVFFQGITIKPLVKYLRVKTKKDSEPCITERITNSLMDQAKTAMEDILGDNSEVPLKVRNLYKRFDESWLKPCLLREPSCPKVLETFRYICTQDAMQMVRQRTVMANGSVPTSKVESETHLSVPGQGKGVDNKGFLPEPEEVIDIPKVNASQSTEEER